MRISSPENSMATRASLLAHLKDSDNYEAWDYFLEMYGQFIRGIGRKLGLTNVEAEDAVQETMLAVCRNIGQFQYQPKKCSFKSWLMLIARQRMIWQIRKRLPRTVAQWINEDSSRTSTINAIPDPHRIDLNPLWEEEWQKQVLSLALERVKEQVSPRQFQIFDLYVLQNWAPREIARTLRISIAAVYLAKHRILALLKAEVRRIEAKTPP